MTGRTPAALLLVASFACVLLASAQQVSDASSQDAVNSGATITFGQFAVLLCGPWKFQIGDSPTEPATGKPLWSITGFDDSRWATMDLTPPPGSLNLTSGESGYIPGWNGRGYPNIVGYAWYRLRVNLHNDSGTGDLALKMPAKFDNAYQVYANGRLIGESGQFTTKGVKFYTNQPRTFRLPRELQSTSVTLAIRMWMHPSTTVGNPTAGGLHGVPIVGQAAAILAMQELARKAVLRFVTSYVVEFFIILLAISVASALFILDRTEPAFLWLALNCLAILVYVVNFVVASTSTRIDAVTANLITDGSGAAVNALWIIFWAAWFRLKWMRSLHLIVWSLALLLGLSWAMHQAPLYADVVPPWAGVWAWHFEPVAESLINALLIWVAIEGFRKNRAEGLLALPSILAVVVGHFGSLLTFMHLPSSIRPFGTFVHFHQLGTMASLCMITVLLLRRFVQRQREREQWLQEIEQARQVQQMLVPDALPVLSGFALQSEYRPSQHVGGDFFQIFPGAEGSLLIIIGDVSGKGLKAAMLVSMIVGALRTLAEQTHEPVKILEGLNRRLCGRLSQQFATCLVVRISANGVCDGANAGHLAPYLNGQEVPLSGSVPLGLVEGSGFEQLTFTLEAGDRMVLITDGIVEAQDASQQLFGFDRTTEIIQQNRSAAHVATAAQRFGQEDDITVISVTHTGALTPSPA
jgi:hypothetical protein